MGRPIKTVSYKGKRVPISEFIRKEQATLKDAVHSFQSDFGRLETALAHLLHAILNASRSKVPFAIYYSPTSFDARADIVSNALTELATETKQLQRLLRPERWPFVEGKIDGIRRVRNAIAHGSSQILIIRNKPYIRWVPPAHDAIRVGRKLAKRQIPGLTSNDVRTSRRPFVSLIVVLEDLNLFVREAHSNGNELRRIYRGLEGHLKAFRNLYLVT